MHMMLWFVSTLKFYVKTFGQKILGIKGDNSACLVRKNKIRYIMSLQGHNRHFNHFHDYLPSPLSKCQVGRLKIQF